MADRRAVFAGYIAKALAPRVPGMGDRDLRDLAYQTLHDFLDDNRVEVGSRRFGWDQKSADIVAREYQTDYWDDVADSGRKALGDQT